ncbi:MAG: hypothetical protein HY535_01745 [Chloroflexi bacterium]|nr:hypothetical protein [Chloroflexota bacterium]
MATVGVGRSNGVAVGAGEGVTAATRAVGERVGPPAGPASSGWQANSRTTAKASAPGKRRPRPQGPLAYAGSTGEKHLLGAVTGFAELRRPGRPKGWPLPAA